MLSNFLLKYWKPIAFVFVSLFAYILGRSSVDTVKNEYTINKLKAKDGSDVFINLDTDQDDVRGKSSVEKKEERKKNRKETIKNLFAKKRKK